MSYFFHPVAQTEHLESVAYYETKRAGLGASYPCKSCNTTQDNNR